MNVIQGLFDVLSQGAKQFVPDTALIKIEQLEAIAPYTDRTRLGILLPFLNATMEHYQINTPLRMAHFLAQTAEESDAFSTNEEYASGSEYEGRADLGNIHPGDGERFAGRGLIECTGEENYRECGIALGVDLIANPERLEDFDLACFSAGWFWDKEGLNALADNDELTRITQIINGGLNGFDARLAYLGRAKQALGI